MSEIEHEKIERIMGGIPSIVTRYGVIAIVQDAFKDYPVGIQMAAVNLALAIHRENQIADGVGESIIYVEGI